MAEPSPLLVQLPQVVSPPAVENLPDGSEPVRMSCMFTASPRPRSPSGEFTVSVSILPQSRADDGADRYGQTSLLVGYRSGAKRRWIEAGRGSASGHFVRRRYSACGVDSCRIVYLVGQPTMSPAARR